MDQVVDCLPTIRKHLTDIQWECVLVSNSEYTTEKLDYYKDKFDDIRLVANDRNRGYAGGVNRGIRECSAPYILVLNPDCRLLDGNITRLLDTLEANPDIASIGPKVIFSNGEVQPSCRRFPKPWTFLLVRSMLRFLPGARAERKRYLMEDFSHESEQDVDWLSGGAVLVRKAAIESVGPMDTRFFLYMEDVDWCRRFWRAGYRVCYYPGATICHDAQHDSLRGGMAMLMSPHTRYHLASMFKYFIKYRFRSIEKVM